VARALPARPPAVSDTMDDVCRDGREATELVPREAAEPGTRAPDRLVLRSRMVVLGAGALGARLAELGRRWAVGVTCTAVKG
jgi:hypothetical protein